MWSITQAPRETISGWFQCLVANDASAADQPAGTSTVKARGVHAPSNRYRPAMMSPENGSLRVGTGVGVGVGVGVAVGAGPVPIPPVAGSRLRPTTATIATAAAAAANRANAGMGFLHG